MTLKRFFVFALMSVYSNSTFSGRPSASSVGDRVSPYFFHLLRCDYDVCRTLVDVKLPVINNLVLIHLEDHLRVTRIHSPLSSRHLEVSRSFR